MAILFVGECEFKFFKKVESTFDVTSNGWRQRADFLVNVCFHVFIKVNIVIVIFGFDLRSQPNGLVFFVRMGSRCVVLVR